MAGHGVGIRQKHHDSKESKSFTRSCDAKMAKESFQVLIHEREMCRIKEWTSMKDNIETGGDLFGLWIDKHRAVVQFVLGPGEGCRRTNVSFHQDTNYLEKAGKYLTKHHGLCNIGQWHSHHRLSLSKPSTGDENTVWGNMPGLAMKRYIVFIANITKIEVTVNCFLFEIDNQGRRLPVLKGNFKELDDESPFRENDLVLKEVLPGQEDFDEKEIANTQKIANTQNAFNKTDGVESESKRRRTKPAEDHGMKRATPSEKSESSSKIDKNTKKGGQWITVSTSYIKPSNKVQTTQVVDKRMPLQKTKRSDGSMVFQTGGNNVKEQKMSTTVANNRKVDESMSETESKQINKTDRRNSHYDNVESSSNEASKRNIAVTTQPTSTSKEPEKNPHEEKPKENPHNCCCCTCKLWKK